MSNTVKRRPNQGMAKRALADEAEIKRLKRKIATLKEVFGKAMDEMKKISLSPRESVITRWALTMGQPSARTPEPPATQQEIDDIVEKLS